MTDKENPEYIEDRDVLGQPKSNDTDGVKVNRWTQSLFIIFGLLFLTVLVYNLGFKDNRQAFYNPDRTIQSRGDFNSAGQGIGLHTDYWEDGTNHRETNYNERGKLQGTSRRWNRNGILVSETNYKNGKLDGHLKEWNDIGELIVQEVYKDDKLTKKLK